MRWKWKWKCIYIRICNCVTPGHCTYIQLCRSWSLYIYPTVSLLVTVHISNCVTHGHCTCICNSCSCWHLVVSQCHIYLHCRLAIASTVRRCYSKETRSVVSGIYANIDNTYIRMYVMCGWLCFDSEFSFKLFLLWSSKCTPTQNGPAPLHICQVRVYVITVMANVPVPWYVLVIVERHANGMCIGSMCLYASGYVGPQSDRMFLSFKFLRCSHVKYVATRARDSQVEGLSCTEATYL